MSGMGWGGARDRTRKWTTARFSKVMRGSQGCESGGKYSEGWETLGHKLIGMWVSSSRICIHAFCVNKSPTKSSDEPPSVQVELQLSHFYQ